MSGNVFTTSTGATVNRIGLGCWQLGADCWGDIDDALALSILQTAAEQGVNFFDTADVYGGGLSETRLGNFLKANPMDAYVATKVGRFGDPGWPDNFKPKVLKGHVKAGRDRLQREQIDLVQLHCVPTSELVAGGVFESLRELQQEGVIRSWGASIESVEEGLLCLTQPGLGALQVIFNPLRQKPADVLFRRAEQMGVKIIVRIPFASGALTGKMTASTQFATNDHRNFNRNGEAFHVGETFNGLGFELAVELAEELKTHLPEGLSLADATLSWILDDSAVSVIIPGASKTSQVVGNMGALSLPPLSADLHAAWRKVYQEKAHRAIRGNY